MAISNTIIGVVLLLVGSVGVLAPVIGNHGVIALLSLLGLAGAILGAGINGIGPSAIGGNARHIGMESSPRSSLNALRWSIVLI